MELKKCQNCDKVFFGHRSLKLCPICTVAAEGKALLKRQQADPKPDRVAVAAITVAS